MAKIEAIPRVFSTRHKHVLFGCALTAANTVSQQVGVAVQADHRFTNNPSLPHFTVTFAFVPHKYDDVASHRKSFTGHAFSLVIVFACS
jgi:hypothetical protein